MSNLFLLILYCLFLIAVSYFATQNMLNVSLHFANYNLTNIPIYIVILVSLFLGIFSSSITFIIKAIHLSIQIHNKNNLIREIKKKNAEIVKDIHQLELENQTLKTKYDITESDEKSLK